MDVSLISIDDAISLLEMYGEPIPNDPDAIYDATYDLLEQLSPDDPLPVAIEDFYGFGSNWYGESGSEDLNLILKAKLIPKLENIIQVASGGMHSLFLRDDGRLYVTGSNIDGRLGLEIKHDVISRPTLVPKPKNIVQVSAGSFESVFLTQDGKLYIYGRTRNFVRDLNDVVKRQEPVVYADTKALNNVISAGYGYTSNTLVLI